MHWTNSDVLSRVNEAALNPDLWPGVFHLLLPSEGEPRAELTLYRKSLGETKKETAVRVQQRTGVSYPEAELLSPFDGTISGLPAFEFSLDDDVYGIHVQCANLVAAGILCERIQAARDSIQYAIKVNRALLSTKTCFCGQRSMLGQMHDPIFRLTLSGLIVWQNESAAHDSWREVYTAGAGKSLTLRQASDQAALRTALSELADAPESFMRTFQVSIPGQVRTAIMALKVAEACYTFTSPWVELFKPAPQVLAVLRPWDSKPNLSPASLRTLYGLTGKEAELAVALAQGVSLKDYAEGASVSFETARWHSKRVMQKMDCAKQQDVMYALLYRNALFSILG